MLVFIDSNEILGLMEMFKGMTCLRTLRLFCAVMKLLIMLNNSNTMDLEDKEFQYWDSACKDRGTPASRSVLNKLIGWQANWL